jgi:predicted MPP superfamily phosphohydrolase
VSARSHGSCAAGSRVPLPQPIERSRNPLALLLPLEDDHRPRVGNFGRSRGAHVSNVRIQTIETMTRRQFIRLGGVIGATGLLAIYPTFIERYLIQTNHYVIAVPNLPQAFSRFRIVHLTDLHYGSLVPLAVIRHVIHRANSLRRDLIVCTGDYVHERTSTAQIDEVWPLLAQLKAPLGVHSVLGNHDHWADTERSQHWLHDTGQDLRHTAKAIERGGERLWIGGAGDLWEDHRNLDEIMSGIPPSDCRIVLAHNPDTADSRFSGRVDLMISGHTHGGQVVIPFVGPPVLPVRNKAYSSGLKTSPRGTRVFISKGIGWAIYPVRFNCPPEIAVLELVPSESEDGFEPSGRGS